MLIIVFFFFVWGPLSSVSGRANDFYNGSIARENNFVCPDGENCVCNVDKYNCNNFTTQKQAQSVFNYCDDQGVGDIHNLDPDGNGRACEGLG